MSVLDPLAGLVLTALLRADLTVTHAAGNTLDTGDTQYEGTMRGTQVYE